jgi:O-antigen ligase
MSFHGSQMPCGVADHKNSLGQLCFVFCLIAIWDLMEAWKANTGSLTQPERLARVLNLGIGLYLLVVSSSATSWMCFLLGIGLLIVGKRMAAMKNPHLVFIVGVLAIVSLFAVQQTYHVSSDISEALGRGEGMSGRSKIWSAALGKNTNYLIGAGFRGFWESSDGETTFKELGTGELITAHNGYIETYLNGGVVGLILLGVFIASTGLIATSKLVEKAPIGRLAVVFWPLILIYNLTESQFMMTGPVWFAMLLTTNDYRREEATVPVKMAREDCQPSSPVSSRSAMAGAAAAHRQIP